MQHEEIHFLHNAKWQGKKISLLPLGKNKTSPFPLFHPGTNCSEFLSFTFQNTFSPDKTLSMVHGGLVSESHPFPLRAAITLADDASGTK